MNELKDKIVKVLVVDDSPFVRRMLESVLSAERNIKVTGFAANGAEALEKIAETSPDVITLDVEMPVMSGLETLRILMSSPKPTPCIMVSSLTKEGADTTFAALEEGAVDFIAKPSSFLKNDLARLQKELIAKIITASRISPLALKFKLPPQKKVVAPPKPTPSLKRGTKVVMIGVSTGGPKALQKIIPELPPDLPVAVVIAQHMPPGFTKSMADRLNAHSKIEVKESEEGDAIIPGRVLLAKSGMHLVFKEKAGGKVAHLTSLPDNGMYYPSINVLFSSGAEIYGGKAMPIVMTGMGNDGLVGMRKLKERGAFGMAQSEETCVVPSMPRAVIEENLADRIVGVNDMANAIIEEI